MHSLAHRFLSAAAAKQKLDTDTEEAKKMRSPHTWPSLPFLSQLCSFEMFLQKREEALPLGSSFLDLAMGVAGH